MTKERLEPAEVMSIPAFLGEEKDIPLIIHYCPSCEKQAEDAEHDPNKAQPRGPYFIDSIYNYEAPDCPHDAENEPCDCSDGSSIVDILTFFFKCERTDFKTEQEAIDALIKIVDKITAGDEHLTSRQKS